MGYREADRPSASQGIPDILWNPKVHYHIYKSPPSVLILSQIDPAHSTPQSYSSNIPFTIILPSTPGITYY
jgi:hypothetical protein